MKEPVNIECSTVMGWFGIGLDGVRLGKSIERLMVLIKTTQEKEQLIVAWKIQYLAI